MLRKAHVPDIFSPENIYLSSKSYFAGDHTGQVYICPNALIQPEH